MRIKKGSVLCVDDEPNILRSLHWMLHRDFDVMTAPDGASALEAILRRDFDVVLMDGQMPIMGGVEAARRIRALPTAKAGTTTTPPRSAARDTACPIASAASPSGCSRSP